MAGDGWSERALHGGYEVDFRFLALCKSVYFGGDGVVGDGVDGDRFVYIVHSLAKYHISIAITGGQRRKLHCVH